MTNLSTNNCRILPKYLSVKKSVLSVIGFLILYFTFCNKFDVVRKSPLSPKKAETANHWDKDEFVAEIDYSKDNNKVKIAIFDQHQEGICLFSINNFERFFGCLENG